MVFKSNRGKGIPDAVDTPLPRVHHGVCCQHIGANIQQRLGILARRAFWTLARASSQAESDAAAVKIRVLHSDAVDYSEEISLEH